MGIFGRTEVGHSFPAGTRFGRKLRVLGAFAVQFFALYYPDNPVNPVKKIAES